MNRALWKKAFGEARWLLAFCAVGMWAFCFLRVWLVSRIEMSKFAEIIGQLWDDNIEKFSTVPLSHLLTYAGRIAVVFNEPLVVLIVTVWAVARGSDVVSGKLGRGTMEMILAQPVSRLQVLYTQAVIGIAGLAVLCASAWAGTATGIAVYTVKEEPPAPTLRIPGLKIDVPLPRFNAVEPIRVPLRERVTAGAFLPAAVNLFALGFFLIGATTFFSAVDRYRWRTIGIISALWVVMMVIKGIGMAVDEVNWLQYCSFFTPYAPEWAVYVGQHQPEQLWQLSRINAPSGITYLTPLGNNLVLISMGAFCYSAAAVIFSTRDLPAPL